MSLNMQQVKDLAITEGDVRTIHDSNGNQLWGYVAYDTKYEGNITQQTYTGKNQFNIETFAQGSITVTDGVATGTAGQFYTQFQNGITLASVSPVMSITATAYRDGTSSSGNGISFRAFYTDESEENVVLFSNSTTTATTLTGSTDSSKTLDHIGIVYGSGSSNVWHISNVQVEAGSIATSYEPYVGGIASPNPDYPQTVNVVTGTQTVTITADDQQSEDFTVSLGSLELCKIGTSQDYIYKSGSDWYVHKELGDITFTGADSENWTYNSASAVPARFSITNAANLTTSQDLAPDVFVNYYTPFAWNASPKPDNGVSSTVSSTIGFRNTSITSLSDWRTWLGTHNTKVYYTLVTATDTKISDTMLLGQLEAIHEWLSRYGYNSSVSGNLSLIINQTNLS